MAMILRTTSYKGLPPNQEISAVFDEQGGTIGRAPNNHLVLPDSEKFVSRQHACIYFDGGEYYVEDTSSGGTYFNDSEEPLPQTRVLLRDGGRLRIGEYELQISLAENITSGFPPSVEAPVRQLDFAENSVLNGPFASGQTSALPAEKADFFSSFVEQPESSLIHQSFVPPQIAATPAKSDVDDLDFGDLLSKLDDLPGTVNSNFQPVNSPSNDLPELPPDFFMEENESFASQSMLSFTEENAQPQSSLPISSVNSKFPLEEFVEVFPEPVNQFAEPVHEQQTTQKLQVSIPESVASVNVVATANAASVTDDRLIREFLAGVGIDDPNFLPPEQWPELMRTTGELLRSMVEGLMQVLRARAELKSQFRVSVTTMHSQDNNPLKFTPNVDDAIRLILAPTHSGFLAPKKAVSEGFNDIMSHQIAMTAGIQAALADILRSFDPQLIEKALGDTGLFQKKAKYWEYYLEKYPQLKTVAQEDFFGDAFADAYEKQMLLLSRTSKF